MQDEHITFLHDLSTIRGFSSLHEIRKEFNQNEHLQ